MLFDERRDLSYKKHELYRRFLVYYTLNVWTQNLHIVTCIARQQTDKHLATTELQMLFLVARQREAPMKSLSGSYVTGFPWSVPCPLPSNDTINTLPQTTQQ
jgi:hypothetical protein